MISKTSTILAGTSLLLIGCGGISSPPSTTPQVSLSATPQTISSGGTATLKWNSQNVTTVASSSFGATAVSGSLTVGPLSATTDYTITCSGTNGSATAHTTVVVKQQINTIPNGVLLYSLPNTDGTSTLYYQAVSGSSPVKVASYAAGTTVFGTTATGTRLLISKPVSATSVAVFETDLDGTSHAVEMGTDTYAQVEDASASADNNVLVTGSNGRVSNYTSTGVILGGLSGITATFADASANPARTSIAGAGASTVGICDYPALGGWSPIDHTGHNYQWVRWSPDGANLVLSDGTTIKTMTSIGTNLSSIATNASYPTYDNTGTRVYYSRVGSGIYVKDLNSGAETKLASITGAWDGRVIWH